MTIDELKEKYTELRERCLELQKIEYKRRADWHIILLGNSIEQYIAKVALDKTFKEDEEKFNSDFPPITGEEE